MSRSRPSGRGRSDPWHRLVDKALDRPEDEVDRFERKVDLERAYRGGVRALIALGAIVAVVLAVCFAQFGWKLYRALTAPPPQPPGVEATGDHDR
jgi:hypothetical protein